MKGIIFDLDGTLWDSRETVARSWNLAIRENSSRRVELDAKRLGALFGKPMMEIFDHIFPDCDRQERERLSKCCCEYENRMLLTEPGTLYDGVREVLFRLGERYPLFIVSNCQAGYIQAFWESTGLGSCFRAGICPDDTGELKGPNIRRVIREYGLTQAVYVGDTQTDADACREAKVPMIFAAYGLGEATGCAGTIASFRELPGELAKLDMR